MAGPLIWSQEALDDINAIAEYISRDSPFYANQVAARFFEVGNSVLDEPKIGRIVPELNDLNVRERFIYTTV